LQARGHTVRLMAPKLVTPYRMSGKRSKNDAADAAAICEAVQRPDMRLEPIKSEEQQSRPMVHRARQGLVEQRTATIHRIRGLLGEFGTALPLKAEVERRAARAPPLRRDPAQTFATGDSAANSAAPLAFHAAIAVAISSVSKIALCSR
jgi:transposase